MNGDDMHMKGLETKHARRAQKYPTSAVAIDRNFDEVAAVQRREGQRAHVHQLLFRHHRVDLQTIKLSGSEDV